MKSNYSTLSNTYNSNQTISNEEVFYYNNGIGFTYEEAINIQVDNVWPLAIFDQIYDAYNNGIDIPNCLWGWGHDGRKYWFSKAHGLICDRYKSPGFYVEDPKPNEKCGIFFYAKKPLETDIVAKCFSIPRTNQLCVFPWRKDQWSKYSPPPSMDCYKEGENPFEDKCLKSYCCEGTTLRLHPRDSNHKDPYYICSSNADYPPNIPPKCEEGLSPTCLSSPFCYKEPTDVREVFYYSFMGKNNINLGFTFSDALDIGVQNKWQIATRSQIIDAYNSGSNIPTCLWGWGLDNVKYWFSNAKGLTCDGYNSPSLYGKFPIDENDKAGVFFYGPKPLNSTFLNCLSITPTDQLCMLPWNDSKWSKYS